MSDPRFEFQGDLAVQPLPEILQTVYHYRVPGVVTAVRDGVEKKIFIVDGTIIFATSSDRADSLGQYLKRHRRISSGELRISADTLERLKGRRHGELLVEMGVFSADELYSVVTDQVRSILYSIFGWDRGSVTFHAGKLRADELIQLNIPLAQAMVDGIRMMEDARRVVSRLGPSWTIFHRGEAAVPDPREVMLSTAERRFLERVDGTKTLRELISVGPADPAMNAKLLYVFYVLGLIKRREASKPGIRKIQWRTGGARFSPEDAGD